MTIDIMRTALLLCLAILLLQSTGPCLSQTLMESVLPLAPIPEVIGTDAPESQLDGEPVEVLHSGSGAALLDNDSHPFWLSVVSARTIEPNNMRNMLTSNRSLDEIRAALGETKDRNRFDGAIKLDDSIYPLAGIKMRQTKENSSTLDADVIEPGVSSQNTGYESAIIGRLALNIIGSGADLLAEGELSLDRGPQAASYRIFLDLQPPR